MSWFSKTFRKAKRWVKRNKRLNRAIRHLRDMLIEDLEDGIEEHVDMGALDELYFELTRLRRR